nr:ribosomal protein S13 [Stephanopyxis turris]
MTYLLETELNQKKSVYFALKKVFGIGIISSTYFSKKLGFSVNLKIFELSLEQKLKLVRCIENSNVIINSELKRTLNNAKKILIEIKSYKGLRRLKGFPIRGQRTRSNARTSKKLK